MSGHLERLLERASAGPPRAVRLRIAQLAIVGVPMSPAQSRQFGAALELELSQLARTPGWPADAAAAAVPSATAPPVTMPRDGAPSTLGRDVARSLFDAVRRAR